MKWVAMSLAGTLQLTKLIKTSSRLLEIQLYLLLFNWQEADLTMGNGQTKYVI